MTALCAASSQPASLEPPSVPGGRDTADWQKELDRACSAGWFHRALAPLPSLGAESAVLQPASRARVAQAFPVLAREVQPLHSASSPGPCSTVLAGPHPARAELPVVARMQSPAPGVTFIFDRNGDAHTVVGQGAGHASAEGPRVPDGGEPAPVRIHAEACGEGVTVWIGIDGDAALVARRSAELLEELLRHARESGRRVEAVICNGTPVYGGLPGNAPLDFQLSGEKP